MATTAKNHVLGTVELLESILANLDMKSLLVCQRVSKHTKAVIDKSAILQQTLFFSLAPASTGRTFGRDGLNPLITSRPQLFKDPRGVDILIESYKTFGYTPAIVETRHCTFIIGAEDVHGSGATPQSWQRMYLVQPPHKIGRIRVRLRWPGSLEDRTTHMPGHVTCGEMFRLAATVIGESGSIDKPICRTIKQAAEATLR